MIEFDPFARGEAEAPRQADVPEEDPVERALRESVEREVDDVVGALEAGRPPLVAVGDALVVQSLVDALYESAETRREIQVEPIASRDSLQERVDA